MSNFRKLCLVVIISFIIQVNTIPFIDNILLILQLIMIIALFYDIITEQKQSDKEEVITYKGKRYKLIYKKGIGRSLPLIEPLDEKHVPNEVVDYIYFKILKK